MENGVMSIECRTCGEPIYDSNPRNLFKQENDELRSNLEVLTGITLSYNMHLPVHMCSCCYLDLEYAIAFRERCLGTHHRLINVPTDVPSYSKIIHTRLQEDYDEEVPFCRTDNIDYTENLNAFSRKNDMSKIESRGEFITLKPRVRIKRYRNPHNNSQEEKSLMLNQSEKYSQPTLVSTYNASGIGNKNAQSTTSILPKTIKVNQVACRSEEPTKQKKRKRRVTSSEKKFVCDQCGWSFRDLSNMKDHALRHSGLKKFQCIECGCKFFTRPLLSLHVRVHHKGEKPFVCKYCEMAFRNSPSRCRHERKYHANELPFACNLCTKMFISKISLEKHIETHVSGKEKEVYNCGTCKKNFKRAATLKSHLLTKFHQRRVNQLINNELDDNEIAGVSDEDIDFQFDDSFIEETNE